VAVLFELMSSALWGTSDFIGGLVSRRRSAYVVVGLSQTAGLIAVTVAAIVTGGFLGPLGWVRWAVLAGVAGSVGLVCFYTALATGTMGVVSPIAALGALVPFLVGILSGEKPSTLALIGVGISLAGACAASGPELRGRTGARSVALAVASGACFGLVFTFLAHGARTDAVMTLWGMRLTSVVGFAAAAVVGRRVVAPSLRGLHLGDLGTIAVIGCGDVAANLFFAMSTQRGFLSITAILGSLYPVGTVLLARIVLHERLSRVQQVAVAAALVGVALVSAP